MSNMKILSGWQRLVIVILIIWAISMVGYLWISTVNRANKDGETLLQMCLDNPPKENLQCLGVYDHWYQSTMREELKDWWWAVPAFILVPPLVLSIIWLFSYCTVKITYWILKGFGYHQPRSLRKKTSLLWVCLIITCTTTHEILHFEDNARRAKFNKTFAECQSTVRLQDLQYSQEQDALALCMQRAGWEAIVSKPGCLHPFPGYYGCY